MTQHHCRHCGAPLSHIFADLGFAPPSNAYRAPEDLNRPETTFPLRVRVCDQCFLVQTEDFTDAETLFSADYAYFSSTSKGWLAHAASYCAMVTDRFGLDGSSFVVELASNDGYLLKNFVAEQVHCLGIEPTARAAAAAEACGVPTLQRFFGKELGVSLAAEGGGADLIIGNNVYAHVPDINDFTSGIAALLKPQGVVTLEFPHLMRLVEFTQFDTIYHEHFSYLSLSTVAKIFARCGLRIFDVEELPTHGGSLRVFGCFAGADHATAASVNRILSEEISRGMQGINFYTGFQPRIEAQKNAALQFLLDLRKYGKTVAGYGAAAKGNTFLNYAGIKRDLLPFVCDAAPAKQGRLLPGSHIPIFSPDVLTETRPDYVVVLPWNIAAEVRFQLSDLVDTGTRVVTLMPEVKVH
ncbi:class I SAM-dependent methyltransferase [Rhodophyticola sp.]|uniref:class I SAM-dependent methyltransferase n=1 Tax=Rhodophyticola sp. TaxID=2680032 RepID=UPI003D275ACF